VEEYSSRIVEVESGGHRPVSSRPYKSRSPGQRGLKSRPKNLFLRKGTQHNKQEEEVETDPRLASPPPPRRSGSRSPSLRRRPRGGAASRIRLAVSRKCLPPRASISPYPTTSLSACASLRELLVLCAVCLFCLRWWLVQRDL
jgi:hypothetical protein